MTDTQAVDNGKKCPFVEFKLMYESAEKVTDRRLETNRWNYSICVAILIAVGVLTNWSISNRSFLWIGILGSILLCLVAIFFCMLWILQIRDFKKLNKAKFDVLNEMAKNLEFGVDYPGTVTSFQPFDKEWDKLKQMDALVQVENSDLIALKSSNIEFYTPRAFQWLFCCVILILVTVGVMQTLSPPTPASPLPTSQSAQSKAP